MCAALSVVFCQELDLCEGGSSEGEMRRGLGEGGPVLFRTDTIIVAPDINSLVKQLIPGTNHETKIT